MVLVKRVIGIHSLHDLISLVELPPPFIILNVAHQEALVLLIATLGFRLHLLE